MFSIIIPHHKETVEQMSPLMGSLDLQQGINFNDIEILIINDNKDGALQPKDFKAFKNIQSRIKTFFNEKEGYMGISRQIGIDNATGEYAIFCDSDDMLYSATILYDLMSRRGADVYSCKFIEEMENHMWVVHEPQFTWMFAKSYRLQFLRDHNIRAHEDVLWHEDTYFNQVMLAYNPTVELLEYVAYLWKYSPNTITRRNNAEYTSKSMCMYIDALDKRLERIQYVIPKDLMEVYKVNDVTYMYCVLQDLRQVEMLNTVREDIEKRLAQYIKHWDPELNLLLDDRSPIVIDRLRTCMQNFAMIPKEGFYDLIKRIIN